MFWTELPTNKGLMRLEMYVVCDEEPSVSTHGQMRLTYNTVLFEAGYVLAIGESECCLS